MHFNTVFQVIPLHPTLENYIHVFEKLPFVRITLNTFLPSRPVVTIFKTITSLFAAYSFVYLILREKGCSILSCWQPCSSPLR